MNKRLRKKILEGQSTRSDWRVCNFMGKCMCFNEKCPFMFMYPICKFHKCKTKRIERDV
jgi:hypothetical protein